MLTMSLSLGLTCSICDITGSSDWPMDRTRAFMRKYKLTCPVDRLPAFAALMGLCPMCGREVTYPDPLPDDYFERYTRVME